MTSGSGDSRMLGGAPLFGDGGQAPMPRGSAVMPETSRASTEARDSDSRGSSSTVVPGGSTARRPMTVGTAPVTRKKGRRARLTVKRIDPWTTLKFSFVYGLAGLIVLLVTVVVLYGVVDAMGVINSIKSFITTVDTSGDQSTGNSVSSGLVVWLGFGRVMLVTIVIGLINVVLFTAFATLTAFIYNVCTDIVGGVEVTLAERN